MYIEGFLQSYYVRTKTRVGKDGIAFMKIEKYGSVMSAYVKNTYEPTSRKQRVSAGKNVDKAVFSSSSGALNGLKASAAKSVESFASPERIAALKAMISDGSYNISAEKVAASILEE